MIALILIIDQFFWKPLVTIADRFKLEISAGEERRFWLVDLWRSASLPHYLGEIVGPFWRTIDRALAHATAVTNHPVRRKPSKALDTYNVVLILLAAGLVFAAARFVLSEVGIGEVGHAAYLGLLTGLRVLALLVFATVVWTPIGVAIGFSPKLARISQPMVQILASFPANFLFPFATLGFIKLGLSLNWGSMLLMALGSQWYLLFNVIGGAQSIPNELREMAASIGLKGHPSLAHTHRSRHLRLLGHRLHYRIRRRLERQHRCRNCHLGFHHSHGQWLGRIIAEATSKGDWPRIVLGVGLMSIFVVGFNRLVWRPLYDLAESKYRLG